MIRRYTGIVVAKRTDQLITRGKLNLNMCHNVRGRKGFTLPSRDIFFLEEIKIKIWIWIEKYSPFSYCPIRFRQNFNSIDGQFYLFIHFSNSREKCNNFNFSAETEVISIILQWRIVINFQYRFIRDEMLKKLETGNRNQFSKSNCKFCK